jgi:hypothetical protein
MSWFTCIQRCFNPRLHAALWDLIILGEEDEFEMEA